MCVCDRERERERETDRQTDRQTDRTTRPEIEKKKGQERKLMIETKRKTE